MKDSALVTSFLEQALSWSSSHVVEIIIFLSVFVEISKIKLNPISAIVKFIFKPIRKEITELGDKIQKDMDELKKELKEEINSIKQDQEMEKEAINQLIYSDEMAEISRIRWEIVEFSNSIENGQLHVRDEYRHIKDDYKRYDALNKKHELDNGVVDEEIEKIEKHYEENKNGTSIFF